MTDLRVEPVSDAPYLWTVTLDGPPGNIIDMDAITGLRILAEQAQAEPGLKGVIFCGEGKHFSFGASVEDHLPQSVGDFLPAFGAIFAEWAATGIPCASAVRGQCLGGGFELAAWSHFLFVDDSARMGVPEIKLGVFPPPASILLPLLVGQRQADDWIISGRVFKPTDPSASTLFTGQAQGDEDVLDTAKAYMDRHLAGSSAFALRQATRAARKALDRAMVELLPRLEDQYLNETMKGKDPVEGLEAFVQRRDPVWVDA